MNEEEKTKCEKIPSEFEQLESKAKQKLKEEEDARIVNFLTIVLADLNAAKEQYEKQGNRYKKLSTMSREELLTEAYNCGYRR